MFYIDIQKKRKKYDFFTYLNAYASVPRLTNVRSPSTISTGLVGELGGAWNFGSTRLFLGGALSSFPEFCGAIFADIDEWYICKTLIMNTIIYSL